MSDTKTEFKPGDRVRIKAAPPALFDYVGLECEVLPKPYEAPNSTWLKPLSDRPRMEHMGPRTPFSWSTRDLVKATSLPEFKPGDVVRYDTGGERHCREGMAIAEARLDGVVLFDTFWGTPGDRHLLTYDELATAKVVFNLDDYVELDRYSHVAPAKWMTYRPADRETVTSQHGLQVRWFIRKGAEPDLQTQIENACEAFVDAQSKLRSAENRVAVAWRDLAELEAQR